jgi:hypothetical protein
VLHLRRERRLFDVSALTSRQFCHNCALANAIRRIASITEVSQSLKLQRYRSRRQQRWAREITIALPCLDMNGI